MSGRKTTLYRLYDVDGAMLYVGITHRWTQRKHEHASRQRWWSEVTSMAFEEFPTREAAAAAEFCAITTESPRYNGRTDGPYVPVGPLQSPLLPPLHEHIDMGSHDFHPPRPCYDPDCRRPKFI